MFNDIDLSKAFDESITGWYLDENLTQKVESVTITDSNVTVYAKVEKGFWITFESNGGTYVEHEFFVNGAFAEEPEKPAKAGYTFDGWYLNTALTLKADFSTLTSEYDRICKVEAEQQYDLPCHSLLGECGRQRLFVP